MNWGRAKTILIIMFLITDLFLFVILIQTKTSVSQISAETIEQTVNILSNHNIRILTEQIPAKRIQNQTVFMENFFAEPELAAQNILGEGYREIEKNPDAYRYLYENDKATLEIQQDGFFYTRKKDEKPFAGDVSQEKVQDLVLEKLSKMNIPKKTACPLEIKESEGLYSVMVIPQYEDKQIYGVFMYITVDSEDILSMKGHWFSGVGMTREEENLLDITAILTEMIYQHDKTPFMISKVESGYYVSEDYLNSREISAVPIYIIKADNGAAYVYDARVGGRID